MTRQPTQPATAAQTLADLLSDSTCDCRRHQALAAAANDIAGIANELHPAVSSLAGRAATGYATTTQPGNGHGTGGHGEPVANLVASRNADGPSRPVTAPHPDLPALDSHLRTLSQATRHALGIVHRHTPPGQAHPDEATRPGCTSCDRLGIYTDRTGGRGDLCAWCYRWREVHPPGQAVHMPDRRLLAIYHDRGKVMTADVRQLGLAGAVRG